MAMKIVRFNCCGMDVHKNLVVATMWDHRSKDQRYRILPTILLHLKLRPIPFKGLAAISSLF